MGSVMRDCWILLYLLHSSHLQALKFTHLFNRKRHDSDMGLVKNHAFIDGNKRIGAHAMLIFLVLNKIDLDYMQDELSGIFLKIAAGEITQDDLLEWIITHQK